MKVSSDTLRLLILALPDPIVPFSPSPIGGGVTFGLRLRVYRVGMFATKAATKDSTDAQVVRLTWYMPWFKLSGRRMTVITTRKIPREKRLKSRALAGKERRISKRAGMGRAMRRTSVKILRAPRITSWPSASEQVPE
jgi:hypothetical protein